MGQDPGHRCLHSSLSQGLLSDPLLPLNFHLFCMAASVSLPLQPGPQFFAKRFPSIPATNPVTVARLRVLPLGKRFVTRWEPSAILLPSSLPYLPPPGRTLGPTACHRQNSNHEGAPFCPLRPGSQHHPKGYLWGASQPYQEMATSGEGLEELRGA